MRRGVRSGRTPAPLGATLLTATLLAATLLAGCDRGVRAKEKQAAAQRVSAAAALAALRGDTVVGIAKPLAFAAIARRFARESYRLQWYDAREAFIEVKPPEPGPSIRLTLRAMPGDSTAITVLDSAGQRGNGRGVPGARRIALAALADAISGTAVAARDAAAIARDTGLTTLRDGRATLCRRIPPPSQWSIVDFRRDASRCLVDRLFGAHYDLSVIQRHDTLAVGSILLACVGSPVPLGWVPNVIYVDLDRCPSEPGIRREQGNVVVFKSPPRLEALTRKRGR